MTNAIGVTTKKNNSAKTIGLTIFEITAPIFSQSLLSVDRREGATIPRNNRTAPGAKIKNETGGTAAARKAFAAPIAINMVPTEHPHARSLPAWAGQSAR